MKKRFAAPAVRGRTLAMAAFAASSLMLLAACDQNKAPPPEPIRPVRVIAAQPQIFEDRSTYTAEIRARYETNLAFRISGKIIARYVEVGSEVKRGALLAKLDPEDTRLAIDNARAQVNAAQSDFNQASSDLERYRRLFDTKVISQAEYDRRQNVFDSAKARLESARSQFKVSENQAGYTDLRADSDGVVTSIAAESGQVVTAGQTVMRLARPEEKEVVFNVSENRLDELRGASSIFIALWSLPDQVFPGVVREIAPGADPVTRTYAVKVSVPKPPATMRLGMTASVTIQRQSDARVVPLPLAALYQQDGKPAIWVFDPQSSSVSLRPVTVAAYVERAVLIADGVKAGEQVVTAGVHKLIPGQKVRLMQDALAEKKS